MDIAELFIAHILWGRPGATHVTPDGKKIYYILDRKLLCVEAPEDDTYDHKSDGEIARIVLDHILQQEVLTK